MSKASKRLTILDPSEHQAFYALPYFNEAEQQHYFTLTDKAKSVIRRLSLSSQLYFILQWGYVKAKRRFFTIDLEDCQNDIDFILTVYFPGDRCPKALPSRNVRNQLQKKIVGLLKLRNVDPIIKQTLMKKAKALMAHYHQPREIFRELLSVIEEKNFLLPHYTTMQTIISHAINEEEARLTTTIAKHLPEEIKRALFNLIEKSDHFYRLTNFKHDLKDFNYRQLAAELEKQQIGKDIYLFATKFLPTLKLSQHNIYHYGHLALYYPVYKLRRMPKEKAYLYLLCYLYTRYQKISENIAQAFIYKVDKYYADALSEANKILVMERSQLDLDQEKTGQLIGLFDDDSLFDCCFKQVAEQAYQVMPREMIRKIKQHLTQQEHYRQQLVWQQIIKKHATITRNLKPLFCSFDLSSEQGHSAIFATVTAVQSLFRSQKLLTTSEINTLPKKFIPPAMKPYLYQVNHVNPQAYEFLVYYRLRQQLTSFRIHLNHTLQFKSFTEDTKAVKHWEQDKQKILKMINNAKLDNDITTRLDELEVILEDLYISVNQRIASGENTYIKIKEVNDEKTWTLAYPKEEDDFDHQFYRTMLPIDISDVFDFVDELCHFMDAFTHLNGRNKKGERQNYCVKAGIIANATRLGIHQMAMRSNLDLQSLTTQQTNYIRLETLQSACQVLVEHIEKMLLFDCYNYSEDCYHASIDGSKQGTKRSNVSNMLVVRRM